MPSPPSVAAYVADVLPRRKSPPDAGWAAAVSQLYGVSPAEVLDAAAAWLAAHPPANPPAVAAGVRPDAGPQAIRATACETAATEVQRVTAPSPIEGAPPAAPLAPTGPRGFDGVVAALKARGHRLKPHRDANGRESYRTACPCHRDPRPSLIVTREAGGLALVHDFGGCQIRAIAATLGLRLADLFVAGAHPVRREEIARYTYQTADGVVVGQKVRYKPKAFRWLSYDAERITVYGLPNLAGASTVILVESEKSVDRLAAMGVAATCGPSGSSRWLDAWSRDLWRVGCRHLVILPDADHAGRQHAERVAQSVSNLAIPADAGIVVTVLDLPGLGPRQDVADWLAAGGTADDLRALADAAPPWSPDWRARDRLARRRMLTLARVRRHRAKARTDDA